MSESFYTENLSEKDNIVLKCIKENKKLTFFEVKKCMAEKGYTCFSVLSRLTNLTSQNFLERQEIEIDGTKDYIWKTTEKLEKLLL